MFTGSAFESWPLIFLGATVFSALFGLATFMGDALLVDTFDQPGRSAVGLAGGAFLGYLGVAYLIRREERGL